jgi:hypothetical protein
MGGLSIIVVLQGVRRDATMRDYSLEAGRRANIFALTSVDGRSKALYTLALCGITY